MRLWSIHPSYLDSKRLVAQWREALLCRNVVEGKTKGYTNHPQLKRVVNFFNNKDKSLIWINNFLLTIFEESKVRNYNFDSSKFINKFDESVLLPVTRFQLKYEFVHNYIKVNKTNPSRIDLPANNRSMMMINGPVMWFEKRNEETFKLATIGSIYEL